jgi:D-beta-D-heptose 7-phosphate kinase/D-beta-D-heptose 1-phosphate adenosyltransferase
MRPTDLALRQVVGYEAVEADSGEVRLVDILPGFSTTSLVDRARRGQL